MISLRERKKAKTREAIQRHGFRLFRKHGYDETTVEQIAAAAEVSPSTFFRYFPTKEDVVMYDAFDPVFLDALRSQPRELSVIEALRRTWRQLSSQLSPEQIALQQERDTLARSVTALRARMVDEMVRSVTALERAIAERVGRPAHDPAVRTLAGATVGLFIAAWSRGSHHDLRDSLGVIDDSLVRLQRGLDIQNTVSAPRRARRRV